jgi:hypothetical protein
MHIPISALILSSFSLLCTAAAVPEAAAPEAELVERAPGPESVYLTNCLSMGLPGSDVAYFKAGSEQTSGRSYPDSSCRMKSNGFQYWETGFGQSCKFNNGVTFSFTIDRDAQSRPNFSRAGTGYNGYRSFICYKEKPQRVLYPFANGGCVVIYYCQ